MNRTALAGLALAALCSTLLVAEALTGLLFSDAVTMGLCGGGGPDAPALPATARPCGPGADARLVGAFASGAAFGTALAVAGASIGVSRRGPGQGPDDGAGGSTDAGSGRDRVTPRETPASGGSR